MKKLIILLVMVVVGTGSQAYADDTRLPMLKIKLINTLKNQNFALCIEESCYAISNNSQPVPLEVGNIDSIVMANMDNMQMYAQNLPDSCKINVKPNQTVTVSGKVVGKNENVYLNDLNCSVVSEA